MQEIAGILSGQMNQAQAVKTYRPEVAADFSFLDVAKATVAGQLAVAEKGSLEEMNLMKKEEIDLKLFKLEKEKDDEDIFGLISDMQKFLKRMSGD